MRENNRRDNQTMMLGCGIVTLLVLAGLSLVLLKFINYERGIARYPGSKPLPGHTQYVVKPKYIRLDQGFLTQDDIVHVHGWYEDRFELSLNDQTDECVILGGSKNQFSVEHLTYVSMCKTPRGQMVLVTRLISRP